MISPAVFLETRILRYWVATSACGCCSDVGSRQVGSASPVARRRELRSKRVWCPSAWLRRYSRVAISATARMDMTGRDDVFHDGGLFQFYY
jgi:hypothetical protein